MRQIARIAGVSVTTVSHVLSGNRPVSAHTADRVHAVIRQYDYVPVSAARRLNNDRSGLIGLVIPDITISCFAHLAKGVERGRGRGARPDHLQRVADSPRRHLDLVREGTVDGLVHMPFDARVDHEIIELAASHPVVIADEEMPGNTGLPCVVADNRAGGRLLGAHLAHLGHRQALIVSGPEAMLSSSQRAIGVKEHFPQALVLRGSFSAEAGYRLVDEALASGVSFTCVSAGNDEQALGAIRRLREEGLSIPRDVSVTGFDDAVLADALGLTTVRQPAIDLGCERQSCSSRRSNASPRAIDPSRSHPSDCRSSSSCGQQRAPQSPG